jgi:AraC family transcriptional regulator
LADAACFSRFHFHRLFYAYTGETPGEFVKRIRLARAAGFLRNNPGLDITGVALDSGFSGSSVFSRAFKEKYGVSPSAFRSASDSRLEEILRNAGFKDSKESQAEGKTGVLDGKTAQEHRASTGYDGNNTFDSRREMMETLKYSVEVKELPALTVAYARHVGPYSQVNEAFARLYRWAGPRGLIGEQTLHLATYHDDPDVTPIDKLRSSACISVPGDTTVDGEIGLMTIPGGTFAVGHFEIAVEQFGDAWNALMGEWLPSSGYQPDDRMCYEVYLNDREKHPEKKFIVDICEPVKPL